MPQHFPRVTRIQFATEKGHVSVEMASPKFGRQFNVQKQDCTFELVFLGTDGIDRMMELLGTEDEEMRDDVSKMLEILWAWSGRS